MQTRYDCAIDVMEEMKKEKQELGNHLAGTKDDRQLLRKVLNDLATDLSNNNEGMKLVTKHLSSDEVKKALGEWESSANGDNATQSAYDANFDWTPSDDESDNESD